MDDGQLSIYLEYTIKEKILSIKPSPLPYKLPIKPCFVHNKEKDRVRLLTRKRYGTAPKGFEWHHIPDGNGDYDPDRVVMLPFLEHRRIHRKYNRE